MKYAAVLLFLMACAVVFNLPNGVLLLLAFVAPFLAAAAFVELR